MKCDYQFGFERKASQLLGELEISLLKLGSAPPDMEVLSRVSQTTQSLTRAGVSSGFEAVANLAREIESVFELARNGKIPLTWELTGLTLVAGDRIRTMLRSPDKANDTGEVVSDWFRRLRCKAEA